MVIVPQLMIICLKGLQKMTNRRLEKENKSHNDFPGQKHSYNSFVLFLLVIIMAVNIFLIASITMIGKRGGI
jgi:hypothetical protein